MNQQKNKTRDVKVVLLGDSGVGKSSILLRFCNNEFKYVNVPTLGAAFMSSLRTLNEINYNFQIWDTAGQEKYKTLANLYYRDAQAAIAVYDISDRCSFDVAKEWINQLKENGPSNIVIFLVGNKQDLIEKEQVQPSEATLYAETIDATFKYTSALEGKGIIELFDNLLEKLVQREQIQAQLEDNTSIKTITQQKKTSMNKGSCC